MQTVQKLKLAVISVLVHTALFQLFFYKHSQFPKSEYTCQCIFFFVTAAVSSVLASTRPAFGMTQSESKRAGVLLVRPTINSFHRSEGGDIVLQLTAVKASRAKR